MNTQSILSQNDENIKKLKDLQYQLSNPPKYYKDMESNILKYQTIKEDKKNIQKDSVESFLKKINKLEDIFDNYQIYITKKKDIESKIKKYKFQLEKNTKIVSKIKISKDVDNKIVKSTSEIKNLEKEIEILNEKNIIAQNILKINEIYEIINSNEILMENLKLEQISLQTLLNNIDILKSLVKKAEILSIKNIVDTINQYAKKYLDLLFIEPIHVKLDIIINKDNNMSLKLIIEYKNSTYDLSELSGGEEQRCNLAFTLAIHEMTNSKILMLDECLNFLSSDINTDVINILKRIMQNKLLIIVSHEAIQGLFDKIIYFDNYQNII